MNKKEATQSAKELLGKMHSSGWRIRVWDNPERRWHYCIYNHMLTVYPSYDGRSYWTLMLDRDEGTGYHGAGSPSITDAENRYFKDPNKAVRHQLVIALKHFAKVERAQKRSTQILKEMQLFKEGRRRARV